MKNNQNQEELCATLGMKYDEVSELFGNETLREMQMAQISGGASLFTVVAFSAPFSGNRYSFLGLGGVELCTLDIVYLTTPGCYQLTWSGGKTVMAKSYQLNSETYVNYHPVPGHTNWSYLYGLNYEPFEDDPSGPTCGCNDPSCGC